LTEEPRANELEKLFLVKQLEDRKFRETGPGRERGERIRISRI